MSGLMDGKRGLIMGLANDKSLAGASRRSCASTARRWPSPIRAKRSRSG
jgi:enoyl-[acyl-carrier-protein] reductase (NADH)